MISDNDVELSCIRLIKIPRLLRLVRLIKDSKDCFIPIIIKIYYDISLCNNQVVNENKEMDT